MNSECREDAQSDDGKFVAAWRADQRDFFELLFLIFHFEANGVYLVFL